MVLPFRFVRFSALCAAGLICTIVPEAQAAHLASIRNGSYAFQVLGQASGLGGQTAGAGQAVTSGSGQAGQSTTSTQPQTPTGSQSTLGDLGSAISGSQSSSSSAGPVEIRSNNSTDSRNSSGSNGGGVSNAAATSGPSLPALTQTPFQRYVADSIGHTLPVYGTDLFNRSPGTFAAPSNIAAPADYILGVGDQIRIRTAGSVSMDLNITVDPSGLIFIPQVGTLNVAGVRLSLVENDIRAAIARQFRDFSLSVTLGQLRSIQVFVLGEARLPGLHTISSLSSLVNALFAVGGPSSTGTLRDIQVQRGGQVVTHLDLYTLLRDGKTVGDVHLEQGDTIYIPLVGPQVAVDGYVTKPAIYELNGPTTAAEILRLAGGLTPLAETARASLDRIINQRREVQDFPLTGAEKLVQLQSGDVLRVFPISPQFDKAVTLRGQVGQPGRYPWRPGMRVSDLIPNRQFLITRRFYNQQNSLAPAISNDAFNADAATGLNNGTGTGRVNATSQDQAAAAATSAGIIEANAPTELGNHETEINWNYAVIERVDPKDLRTQLVPFALGEAVDNPASPENKVLQAGDVVVIYSRADINLPVELRARFVRIDGEVVRPGIYRLEGNETLRDVLARAGGVAPHGYLYAAQFTRESVRLADEAKQQQLIQRLSREIFSPANQIVGVDGRTTSTDLEVRQAYIAALSRVRPTGRVTLHLSPGSQLGDLPALQLQDGDRFFVPSTPNTIDVLGNVFNPGAQLYTDQRATRFYLHQAGGKTRDGDTHEEYLLRADGTVLSRETNSRFDKLAVYPGDTIIVPAKLKPGFNAIQALTLTQALSNAAITLLAVRSLN